MAVNLAENLLIWASRPRHQNGAWCDYLRQAGYDFLDAPLMAIEPADDRASLEAIKSEILKLDEYAFAIFVSQNAVAHAMPWVDRYWPQWPYGQTVLAIGNKTAAALADAAPEVLSPQGVMDTTALLALPALASIRDKKILIFRGQGGLPTMAEALAERGAVVRYCELYRRAAADISAPDTDRLKAAIAEAKVAIPVFSGETLKLLTHRLKLWQLSPQRLTLVVPGLRVAKLAKTLSYGTVLVAENATQESMLAALKA